MCLRRRGRGGAFGPCRRWFRELDAAVSVEATLCIDHAHERRLVADWWSRGLLACLGFSPAESPIGGAFRRGGWRNGVVYGAAFSLSWSWRWWCSLSGGASSGRSREISRLRRQWGWCGGRRFPNTGGAPSTHRTTRIQFESNWCAKIVGVAVYERSPKRCPQGHRLGPDRVLVGWRPCGCPTSTHASGAQGHRSWECRVCGAVILRPPHTGPAWFGVRWPSATDGLDDRVD